MPDHGFLVTGRQTFSFNGKLEADALLLRTDSAGNLLWTKQYGDTLWEELSSVRITADSNLILTGATTSFGHGAFDILLMKTDMQGTPLWSKTFGGTATDAAYEIFENADESLVLSGYTDSYGHGHRGDDSTNIFLMKTDATGNLIWMETYGDGLQDEGFRCNVATDGGYLIPGFTVNYMLGDSSQMVFIKTDAAGLSGCHEEAVVPADTDFAMPVHPVTLSSLAGMNNAIFGLTVSNISPPENDLCSFVNVPDNSVDKLSGVYPNPFSEKLIIDLKEEANANIEVLNSAGDVIFTSIMKNKTFIVSTISWPAGIYFIKIISDKKVFRIEKAVKE
jgi:hypothetical protein